MSLMNQESWKRVPVWNPWLRMVHWFMAVALVFMLVGPWLSQHADVDVGFWMDWHLIVGQLLIFMLAARVFLFFRKDSAYWRALIPTRQQGKALVDMLKFYLSLGRMPLPRWFAHNPFWAPIYLLMWLLLLVIVLTGVFMDAPYYVLGYSIKTVHGSASGVLGWLAFWHVLTAFIHDWKGESSDISAMLNGYRWFKSQPIEPLQTQEPLAQVSVNSLLDGLSSKNKDQS